MDVSLEFTTKFSRQWTPLSRQPPQKQTASFTKQLKISKKPRTTTAKPQQMKSFIDRNWTKRRKFWRREIGKFGWQSRDTIAAVHLMNAKRVRCFPPT